MLPLLILALVAGPLVEIALTTQILVWAPWPLVLAVIVVGSATGLVVLRQHGLAGLQRWRTAHRRGDPADVETVVEGLRVVAGLLLAVPGVVTTVAGLILLAHPLRRFVAMRVASAGKARRERLVPRREPAAEALPPPPPHPALGPGDAYGDAFATAPTTWDAAMAPATGYIAGQTAHHGAVADDFFVGPAPAAEARPDAGPVPVPASPGPGWSAAPGVAAPPVAAQTAGWSPAVGAPSPPRAPDFMWDPAAPEPAPERDAPVPAAPAPTAGGDEWDTFMTGRAWEDEPAHKRGRKGRRRRRGGAGPGSDA